MPTDFTLRPMLSNDGPALKRLMENDPVVGTMSSTTYFLTDAYSAWVALKPNLIGMVAEAPGFDGLAAAVTMALDDAQFNGETLRGAYLENLKVDHSFRGQKLGARIVEAVAAETRKQIGDSSVLFTGMSPDNLASINSMKSWSKQVIGPLAVAARPTTQRAPRANGVTVRAAEPRDYAEIADKSNRFYRDYNLYPPQSADKLSALLSQQTATPYFVAVDSQGNIVAGALLTERFRLMYDEFQNIPRPLELINTVVHLIPQDHKLRMVEANLVWFDSLDAGRQLWQTLKWLYRDQADIVAATFDPRSPLKDVYQIRPWHVPKINVTIVVGGPSAMNTDHLLTQPPRG